MMRRACRARGWCILLFGGIVAAGVLTSDASGQRPAERTAQARDSQMPVATPFRPGNQPVLPRLKPDPVPLGLRVTIACYTATWPEIDSLIRQGRSPRLLIDGRDSGLLTEYRRWCPGKPLRRTDIVGMWYLIPDAAGDVWGSAGDNGMVRVLLPERARPDSVRRDSTRHRPRAGAAPGG